MPVVSPRSNATRTASTPFTCAAAELSRPAAGSKDTSPGSFCAGKHNRDLQASNNRRRARSLAPTDHVRRIYIIYRAHPPPRPGYQSRHSELNDPGWVYIETLTTTLRYRRTL